MDTRGVASVRSPVRNLQQYGASVSHEKFVEAVIDSFRKEYSIDSEVKLTRFYPLGDLTGH